MTLLSSLGVNVFQHYREPAEEEIRRSLIYIENTLSNTRKVFGTDDLESSTRIADWAVNHFDSLPEPMKASCRGIANLLNRCSKDPLSRNRGICDRTHQRLLCIFYPLSSEAAVKPRVSVSLSAVKPCPSPPIALMNGIIEEDIGSEAPLSQGIPKTTPNRNLSKTEQIAIIENFFNVVVRDYYGPFVLGDKEAEMGLFNRYVVSEFSRLFPPIISGLFFKEPGKITDTHKALIVSAISGFRDFMNILLHGDMPSTSESLTLETCQVTQEILQLYARFENVEQAGNSPEPNEKTELLHLLTTVTIVPFLFNKVLTPHLFCMLTEAFALKETDEIPSAPLRPLEEFDGSDKVFSAEIKPLVEEISGQLLNLGGGNGLLKLVNGTLSLFLDTIGTSIQQAINRALASENGLTPVMILQKILYSEGSPVLLSQLSKSPEEIAAYQAEISKQIHDKVYKLVKGLIPTGLGWLAKRTVDLKCFCETLVQKLFDVTQNEVLYKQLTLCILKSTRLKMMKLVPADVRLSPPPSLASTEASPLFTGRRDVIPSGFDAFISLNGKLGTFDPSEDPVKQLQIDTIKKFFVSLVKDYFGPIVLETHRDAGCPVHAYAIQEFSRLFPPTISHFFFSKPGSLTETHKTIITSCLKGTYDFLKLHNSGGEVLSSARISTDICRILQEILWTSHEISKLENQDNRSYLGDESAKMLHLLIGAYSVPFIFNKVLTPHLFCMFLEIFALERPSLSLGEVEKPLDFFSDSDPKFSNDVGQIITHLSEELIILGKGSAIFSAIPMLLAYFSRSIGSAIQKAINRSLSSECSMKPILILQNFLFKDGKPILLDQFSKSPEEIAIHQVEVNKKIRQELSDTIESFLPRCISRLAESTIGLKSFCETMSHELFLITQNERLYKSMFFCILKSIHQGLLQTKGHYESKNR